MRVERNDSQRMPSRTDRSFMPRSAWHGYLVAVAVMTVWGVGESLGAPARPGAISAVQPDGAVVTVIQRGDENGHWYEDGAGRLVTRVSATGQWVYAKRENGQIRSTGLIVGQDAAPEASRVKAGAMARGIARPARVVTARSAPTSGTLRNLVILVNFTDLTVAHTTAEYENLFNLAGYSVKGAAGSVKDYYSQVSYGALVIQSTVVEAVTLDHGYAYYGQNDAMGYDLRPQEMVAEALAKLEARGFDFGIMDGNGDGEVDGLTVVHAGEGEEIGNDPDAIWAHMWELEGPVIYDGVSLQPYATAAAVRETGKGIVDPGIICHELGHVLGLPDLYDRDYTSAGAGEFCLMAGGSWNGAAGWGESPAHLCAWCKIQLGWVAPTVLAEAGSYDLAQVETNAQVYKLQGAFPSNEYFLVENRQGVGFDAALPGVNRGILIWHVDDSKADNDDETHYMVGLEEADGSDDLKTPSGTGDDGDYYRQGNATEFSDTTTPNTEGYAGNQLGLGVMGIGASGGTMDLSVVLVEPVTISGFVGTSTGAGISGVLVSAGQSDEYDITDVHGNYEVEVRKGWSGTITPSKPGYTFTPETRTYTAVDDDVDDQDYTAEIDGAGAGTGMLSIVTVDGEGDVVSGKVAVDGALKGSGSWSGEVDAGAHAISFGKLSGHVTPSSQVVIITNGKSTNLTATYASAGAAEGMAVVVTADPGLISPGRSSLVMTEVVGGTPPYTYLWDTKYKRASFVSAPKATTSYEVVVTDSLGATGRGSITVEVNTSPLLVWVEADPNVVNGDGQTSTLTASVSGGVTPYEYLWSTGAAVSAITVTPMETTDYHLTVTDGSGQEVTVTKTVYTPEVAAQIVTGDGTVPGGAPCFAPVAAVGFVLIALMGWAASSARRGARGPRRST
ncbi:MAG: M6 family metalloprotease domain-containing protein [Phycisphaerae bacterium]|nr:M6 family metalloprotease domain-containing protein [Phycisphaerae bacterium]